MYCYRLIHLSTLKTLFFDHDVGEPMGQDKKTYLVTGANRGLGLGITKELLSGGSLVLATTRTNTPSSELSQLATKFPANLKIFVADMNDQKSIDVLAGELKDLTLDVLVNNAGVFLPDTDDKGNLKLENINQSFVTNAIGPMRITQALLPHLKKSSRPIVATLSTLMASITDNTSGGSYGYRMSKVAVNMWSRNFARDHKNIISVAIHPGWVQTDMGGFNAPLSVEESCKDIVQLLTKLEPSHSGEFVDHKGKQIPW